MSTIQITLPDGSTQSVAAETRPIDIARAISPRLADAAIAAKINGEMFDLTRPLEKDATVQILTAKDPVRDLWSENVGAGTLFGGFDFNRDGWTDVGLVRSRETGEIWGNHRLKETWIDLVDGKTGTLYPRITPPVAAAWL